MKHSHWLRLTQEGENLCLVLREQGYQCFKQVRRLSWKVSKHGDSYLLTYLPAPISSWTVLPNNASPAREQILSLVSNALKKEELGTLRSSSAIQPRDELTRPWVIVRLLSDARRYTVARFYNRQDAHDHKRVLSRFMPAAEFEVVFDPWGD
ncbi:MAG TPA: hypothetical protein DDZ80_21285 [Cyanobacteria bacterium UBA8803]|nr:hypothetical protein [Cyanobacteria bacterium UBA9273]HBL60875.1 hypothetical protein [Cyanobacteria bacterium UBA8803]